MVQFGLVDAICQSNFAGCGAFKSKETRLCERNRNTFTLNSYYIYPYSCFHFTVNEMSRNKTKSCPRRLTAVEPKTAYHTDSKIWSEFSKGKRAINSFNLTDFSKAKRQNLKKLVTFFKLQSISILLIRSLRHLLIVWYTNKVTFDKTRDGLLFFGFPLMPMHF